MMARACMSFSDSIVSISWRPVSDGCGSFTKYSLYGQVENDPFVLIDDIPNRLITEYPYKLNDLNPDRSFYITVDHLCDNSTTVHSDTISIDLTQTGITTIDSVSIDIATQKTIVGWTPNIAPDTKYYILYDYKSGDGDSVTSTFDTFNNISNTLPGRYPIVLATVDSCNLLSPISTPHQTSLLQGSLDKCNRSVTLNWSLYSGWDQIDSQQLFISIDDNGFIRDTTISGGINSLSLKNIKLGPNYKFYVRSFTGKPPISSSSNITEIQTTAIEYPGYLYLNLATVFHTPNDPIATPSILWTLPELGDTRKFNIYRGEELNNLLLINQVNIEFGELSYWFDDFSRNAINQEFYYQVEAVDECDTVLASSNISSTIHLAINPLLVHNEYINWDIGVREYKLMKLEDGSTWNTLYSENKPFTTRSIDFTDSSGCYQVTASEITNQYNSASLSQSNIVCIEKDLQFAITTALNTQSTNNRFIILGEGVDYDKSYYKIYNRWGQEVANNPANKPWYADYKGKKVSTGMYIYTGEIFGLKGERQSINGTIHVVR